MTDNELQSDNIGDDNTPEQCASMALSSSNTSSDKSTIDDQLHSGVHGDESCPENIHEFELDFEFSEYISNYWRNHGGIDLSDENYYMVLAKYQESKMRARLAETKDNSEEEGDLAVELSRATLRAKLLGQWYDDNCRNCEQCVQRNTYTHGPFRNTAPNHSPDPTSPEDICSQAQPMSKSIWNDYEKLKTIVERYETTIQKRWAKRTYSKRKQALQLAWATTSSPPPQPLLDVHMPEVAYLSTRCDQQKGICNCSEFEESQRHIFLWPRMNIEDLTMFEPLLLLLNARGRHSPPTFAIGELSGCQFGWKNSQLKHPPYLDLYSMLFTGQESPEDYGRLVCWEEDPQGYKRLHMGCDLSPGEGLLVLEIQQRLYRFLVNICQIILYDHQVEDHGRLLAQPVVPEPSLPTANSPNPDMGTSLMITRYESAYHLPAKLDVRRLQLLVESKLAEAEDTLWALREDPDFFSTTLAAMHQSRPEHIRDIFNNRHPSVVTHEAQKKLMKHVVGMLWRQYVSAIEIWEQLYDKVSRLADLKEQLFDNAQVPIRPEDDLPKKPSHGYLLCLVSFQQTFGGTSQRCASASVFIAKFAPPTPKSGGSPDNARSN